MIKYVNTMVTFSEVPNEISLCIEISNCPCHCKNCHSSYLAQDIGTELTFNEVRKLIKKNSGISCIALMGGDAEPDKINTTTNNNIVRDLTPQRRKNEIQGFNNN